MGGNVPERGEGEQGSTRPKGGTHHLDVGVSRHEQVKLGTLALLSKDGGRPLLESAVIVMISFRTTVRLRHGLLHRRR